MVLLELHEFDLVQMRAIFSPSAQKLLLEEKERRKNFTGNNFVSYPSHEVTANRDEILKLTERVEFLHKHCIDTIQQVRGCVWGGGCVEGGGEGRGRGGQWVYAHV